MLKQMDNWSPVQSSSQLGSIRVGGGGRRGGGVSSCGGGGGIGGLAPTDDFSGGGGGVEGRALVLGIKPILSCIWQQWRPSFQLCSLPKLPGGNMFKDFFPKRIEQKALNQNNQGRPWMAANQSKEEKPWLASKRSTPTSPAPPTSKREYPPQKKVNTGKEAVTQEDHEVS
ncbi:hypothetical protein RHGRI_011309 [Rhododendron griersonianum]|uniref:Uncharacterized protein n=1 Tax=Rhododendron griersonianum TaxID=479676 RepID=A0AAV6KMP4_9ERIC|nr:hypothetical protein RHGRI_011309 [Rhododendron griersonianum]